MLKSLKITAVVAIAYASVLSSAQAGVAEDLQNICTIVKADDKSELRKKNEESRE